MFRNLLICFTFQRLFLYNTLIIIIKKVYFSNHKGERCINDQKCYKKITLPVAQLFLVLIQQPTLLTDDFHFPALTVVLI